MTWVTALIAAFLAAGTMFFTWRRPEYRPDRDTISELGERGVRDARLVGFALFLPVGLACLAISWHTRAQGALSDALSLLSLALAVGYLTAVVFPCDPGSPIRGTWRQELHNLGGGFEYVVGALGLWRVGQAATPTGTGGILTTLYGVAAVVEALLAVVLSVGGLSRWRGGLQRVAEALLFGGLVGAAWLLETAGSPR